jgi:glycosyltransferase involved in cell wall biosynthesis
LRVLAITPKVDPDDDLLGFVHAWLSRLAARVDRLYVLQLWQTTALLPPNARLISMGKDGGRGKPAQLAIFLRVVGGLCLQRRVDAVLAHMGPIFAVLAAPFCRATGIPLALWYAHGAVSPTLRFAHRLVDRVGTSTPAGFRIPSRKVVYTGQGIETELFRPPPLEPEDGPLVSVGRISPIKDYETVLRALARPELAARGAQLEIVGGTKLASEQAYADRLRALASELQLGDRVHFRAGVPHREVAEVYQRAALFLSASRTGSLDKAVLEALACARLAVTSNEAFGEFFGEQRVDYTFPAGDPAALADRLGRLLSLAPPERRQRGLAWRVRVEAEHSVDHLADELVRLLAGIRA